MRARTRRASSDQGQRWALAGAARRGAPAVSGLKVRMLVLAVAGHECAAADLETGAFLRARSDAWPALGARPFDVVDADLSATEEVPDPARPETVYLGTRPRMLTRLSPRRTRRFLRPLVSQPGHPLLGFPGPSVPYWTMTGTSPSLALVRPEKGPELFVSWDDGGLWARFNANGAPHTLPVEEPELAATVAATGARALSADEVQIALGGTAEYVLVSLSLPRAGSCSKVVAAVLRGP